MFSAKDRTAVPLKAMVVYKFSCAGCNARYNVYIQTLSIMFSYVGFCKSV